MHKIITVLLFFIASIYRIEAQSYFITGIVKNQQGELLTGASVILLKTVDSAYIKSSTTDENGKFQLQSAEKNVIIKISFIGYENTFIDKEFTTQLTDLKSIALT